MSCVRKHGGSDMNESNPYEDQTTHLINYVKNPNATNSTCNHKKWVPHLKHNQQYAYHQQMKET
jgi:hypothetical protein